MEENKEKQRVLLNENDAGKMLGLKVTTLRKRRWAKMPPRFLKIGSKVYYVKQDLEDYLDSCIRNPIDPE